MQDSAAAKFVFRKDSGVEWNLVPIGKCITRFEAETPELRFIGVMFDIRFHRNIDAVRQASFGLDSEIVIRSSEMNDRVFIDETGVDRSWWKDISVGQGRES